MSIRKYLPRELRVRKLQGKGSINNGEQGVKNACKNIPQLVTRIEDDLKRKGANEKTARVLVVGLGRLPPPCSKTTPTSRHITSTTNQRDVSSARGTIGGGFYDFSGDNL